MRRPFLCVVGTSMGKCVWQPTASIPTLQARALALAHIRAFFSERGVMEVETPQLAATTVTDPQLDSLSLVAGAGFLQTSPEYFMKRLLSAGSGPIFSMAKAFRADEQGKHHSPEFTMLEWYRPGFDDRQLAEEVVNLVGSLAPASRVQRNSYAELFQQACGLNPHQATVVELRQLAGEALDIHWLDENKSLWLDLLFTHLVEPTFSDCVQVVFDYPECQSALAKVEQNAQGEWIARRFEVYWKGLELANGYWELTDANEQRRRFDADVAARKTMNKRHIEPDQGLLAALDAGMPACAGVALGVDRLLMCLLELTSIEQVQSFRG